MKLILSRKGFDSSAGGVASPIFPDGTMYSLPIKAHGATRRYREVGKGDANGSALGSVVEQLTKGRVKPDDLVHLDPDLDSASLPRMPGWRPAFGQTGAAQRHLEANGIGVGDVFLFFGWFRRLAQNGTSYRFEKGAPDLHVLFGWLQVGEVVRVDDIGATRLAEQKPWLADHPHLHFRADPRNTIYVASDQLVLPGLGDTGLPGAGEMKSFDMRRTLTAPEASRRSLWALPSWFTSQDASALTYNAAPRRWSKSASGVLLDAATRGQEFVLDCARRPLAGAWIKELLS